MLNLLNLVKEKLGDKALQEQYKKSPKDFTRKRKLGFKEVLEISINKSTKSLSLELYNYFNMSPERIGVTTSAYIQAREKIKPNLYKELALCISEGFYTPLYAHQQKTYLNRYRVLGVDGSLLELPQEDELVSHYGVIKSGHIGQEVVRARMSGVYDVMNKLLVDVALSPLKESEPYQLRTYHLNKLGPTDLLVLDRGYSGYDLLADLDRRQIQFVIRAKVSHSNLIRQFYESDATSCEVLYPANKHIKDYKTLPAIRVRFAKIQLSSGEQEILITSLLDEELHPLSNLDYLYNLRWQEEEFFKSLKSQLKIETFSGTKADLILQDFYIALLIYNLYAVMVIDLEPELQVYNRPATRKYKYQVNKNAAFGFLKQKIIPLLRSQKDERQIYDELKALFFSHKLPIRPGRSNPRNFKKYDKRHKPKSFNNQKFNA